jgi:hypothetical protein
MFANMQNYENYKWQVHFCVFTSLHVLNFACYHTCYQPMTKFASFQVCKINKNIDYKLIITTLQFHKLQVHVCKLTSLQVCKFTSSQVCKLKKFTNYELIITILQFHKLQVHVCKFTSLQVTN